MRDAEEYLQGGRTRGMALLSSVYCPFINAVARLGPDVSDPADATPATFNTSPFNNLSGAQVTANGDAQSQIRAAYVWPPLPGAGRSRDARVFWRAGILRYRRFYTNDLARLQALIQAPGRRGYLSGDEQDRFLQGTLFGVRQVLNNGFVSGDFFTTAGDLQAWGDALVAGRLAGGRYKPRVAPPARPRRGSLWMLKDLMPPRAACQACGGAAAVRCRRGNGGRSARVF